MLTCDGLRKVAGWAFTRPAAAQHTLWSQAPWKDRPEYRHADRLADELADLLAPQAGSYYDVWLDGEKFYSAEREVRDKGGFCRCTASSSMAWIGQAE